MRIILLIGFLVYFAAGLAVAEARQYAAMIVDERSGKVLHAENPDMKTHPASLAKIMTLYLVFEQLRAGKITMSKRLPVSAPAARRPPSKLGLRKGQSITVRNAISALITKSANDVATVVAEAVSGTETRFAALMTDRARQLGMTATVFQNASGLPDRNQVTTARDMARLSIAIRRDFPKYFDLFSMKSFKYGHRQFRNHNNLLARFPGTTGIKTGYINASGFNLAVSVERDGRRLIGVIFGGKTSARRDNRMITLLRRTLKMMSQLDRIVRRNAPVSRNAPIQTSRRTSFGKIDARPSNDADQRWGIQIGAYSRFAQAFLAANRAVEAADGLRWARVSVEQSVVRGKRLYRARLLDISQNRAMRACRELKAKRVSCQVVQIGETAEGDR